MFINPIFSSESAGIDTGDIGHSLRFRSGSYLTRTPGSSDSRRLITLSMWVKRCALGVFQRTFGADDVGSTTFCVGFNTNNKLEIRDYSGSYLIQGISTQVFRDTTSWIHVVVAFDTNQTTFSNAVKAYVNGVQITAWDTSTYSGAHDMQINDTRKQSFGVYLASGVPAVPYDYGLDYLARPCLVTGVQLTPSSFGYLNTEINEWVSKSQSAVKAVVDAGGTNSFMLDFDDGASTTTLGYDKSSKGNNWTLNNVSLTAGATYDWMLDVPGNSYATLNPLHQRGANTFINANLGFTHATGDTTQTGTLAVSSGKWYWEVIYTAVSAGGLATLPGIIKSSVPAASMSSYGVGGIGYSAVDGRKYVDGAGSAYGAVFVLNDVIGVALDCDASTVTFYKNNVSQGAINIASGSSWYPASSNGTGSATQTGNINFGQRPFTYTPPTGFKALCQANLPDVSAALLNPKKHFDTKTQLGSAVNTGANLLAQFTDFTADLAWGKDRAAAASHQLVDTVRGSTAVLKSDSTAAETTYTAPTAGDNCVAWGFKAGGAAVTNNAGSISSQVSANTAMGFSIVTYNETAGVAGTVGHGLATAPKLIVHKRRGASVGYWWVWHSSLGGVGNSDYLILNQTGQKGYLDGASAPVNLWNATSPTSSVFSVGTYAGINASGQTHVAYCFADSDIIKCGSYTGNGSADGPFVHCGFKPKYVMVKRTDTTGDWQLVDTTRDTYNVMAAELNPNLSNAESSVASIDACSNGFKLRTTDAGYNASGGTYIYIAIAETCGKYSLAR